MSQHSHLNIEIKKLKPWEVFDFFEGPRFYSCKNQTGQIYLVHWVDEINDCDVWLYSKVSFEKYCALKNKKIDIRSCFENPEEGFSYLVSVASCNEFNINLIKPEEYDSEWLPDDGEFLDYDSPSTSLPTKIVDVQEAAVANSRQVLDLAFSKKHQTYEIASETLGKILTTVQSFIYSSACSNDLDVRRVPEYIKDENMLMVSGLFASSFGVRLQSKNSDLFSGSNQSNNLQRFMELLATTEESDQVLKEVKNYNLLSRARYKAVLQELVTAELSVKAEWSDPYGNSKISRISFHQIKESLRKLEEGESSNTQIVEYKDIKLVGVDIENDFFAVVKNDGELLKGKLDKSLESYQFNVPSIINVKIEETCKINPVTDKEKWSYKLIEINSSALSK
ncbi:MULTISPECIES: DUF6575 domain-containing protein [unclassified Halomonas]|uniref:DUF6575 domain-containing protein n=1 Tax=unclassified Halomonas TaxID=2609666 RepID=UPI0007D971AC|nr:MULTISPECIES: DUF6575 domain-containing protein [unclassified Halomonas]MBT2786745.1 hypothetical protein [Halomonas sp. ISL-106]MBT2798602.1 hypothetical protein [Halomonas sp. ISL-104]OAL58033.1 hypothetical protein A6R74_09350 [Halomonas sp. ALS9]